MVKSNKSNFLHPTSIVDDGASIGSNTKIWHWTHISPGAKIGNNCSLGQNVYVANNVIIGNNVKVQNNVSLYDNVVLGDNVFCGPSMVFTNVYNPRSEVNRKNEYQDTYVENGVTFGANCTILCGIKIGEYAFIGAGALVNKSVKAFALMVGVPARQIGWMSTTGERIPLPLVGNENWKCPETGGTYLLRNDFLIFSKSNN